MGQRQAPGSVCDAVGYLPIAPAESFLLSGRGEEPPSRGAGAGQLRPGPDPQAVVR